MGNLASCAALPRCLPRDDTVKLVHSNGLVEQFYRSVRVAELSPDYPHHFICDSGDLRQVCRGDTLRKLSDDDCMQLGQIYFLLPSTTFELPLTSADVAGLVNKAGVARKARCKGVFVSMLHQMKPPAMALEWNGDHRDQEREAKQTSKVSLSRELILKLIEETRMQLEAQAKRRPATIANSQAAQRHFKLSDTQTGDAQHMPSQSFTSLWRPSLETIREDQFAVS